MTVVSEFHKEVNYATHILDFGNYIKFNMSTQEHNDFILDEFYKAVEWLLKKGYDEYVEIKSNTINPAQQNAFIPLREYRVLKNGHYRKFKIYTRCFGGCCIEEI